MPKTHRYPIYIREWRVARNISCRRLAKMLAEEFPEESDRLPRSEASVSRIETGEQPYSRPALEAMAYVLRTTPGLLISRPPDGAKDLWDIWNRLNEDQRETALRILEAIAAAD